MSDPDATLPATYPTGGMDTPATGGVTPRLPPQDLSHDRLLSTAPRMQFEAKEYPSLGGLPIFARLGQGGMGAVYYAYNPRLEKELAIKVLPGELAEKNDDAVKRFFREARTASRVASPHLVGVLDVNEDRGVHYIVMEFVRGLPANKLARSLPEARALQICAAACAGLEAAHQEGIVHRDIKPANILVPFVRGTESPDCAHAKLADLGLARDETRTHSLTGANAFLGTPGFMPPEQIDDAAHAGKPADVFAMGATLYALLAGFPPFKADKLMEILRSTADKPHTPIREHCPGVSVATAALIDRCLAKDPAERFPDAAALHQALLDSLAKLGDLEQTHLSPMMPVATQLTPPAEVKGMQTPTIKLNQNVPSNASAAKPPVRDAANRKGILAAGCAFVIVVLAIGIPVLSRQYHTWFGRAANVDDSSKPISEQPKIVSGSKIPGPVKIPPGPPIPGPARIPDAPGAKSWSDRAEKALKKYFEPFVSTKVESAANDIVAALHTSARDAEFQSLTVTKQKDSVTAAINIRFKVRLMKTVTVLWTFSEKGHISSSVTQSGGINNDLDDLSRTRLDNYLKETLYGEVMKEMK